MCSAERGESTITWTLANDSGVALHAVGERIFIGPATDVDNLASGLTATATKVIPGPAAATQADSGLVAVEAADWSYTTSVRASVAVPACDTPPPALPDPSKVVLSGAVVCNADTAQSTIMWTLANDSGGAVHAVGERIFVGPATDVDNLASGLTATATEVIPGPAAATQADSGLVVVESADFTFTVERHASVPVPACGTPPPALPIRRRWCCPGRWCAMPTPPSRRSRGRWRMIRVAVMPSGNASSSARPPMSTTWRPG